MCVRSPISHHNFVKWEPIVTRLYMVITEYDISIVYKYRWYRSWSPKNVKNMLSLITREQNIVEMWVIIVFDILDTT